MSLYNQLTGQRCRMWKLWVGSEAGDRLGQPIASASFFRCGQGPRSLPTLKCEVLLSGERIGVLRVCHEKSEAKSSRPQVEKASWVLGAWLSSLCRRETLLTPRDGSHSSLPELAVFTGG